MDIVLYTCTGLIGAQCIFFGLLFNYRLAAISLRRRLQGKRADKLFQEALKASFEKQRKEFAAKETAKSAEKAARKIKRASQRRSRRKNRTK